MIGLATDFWYKLIFLACLFHSPGVAAFVPHALPLATELLPLRGCSMNYFLIAVAYFSTLTSKPSFNLARPVVATRSPSCTLPESSS